jgi:hypothetical protein
MTLERVVSSERLIFFGVLEIHLKTPSVQMATINKLGGKGSLPPAAIGRK